MKRNGHIGIYLMLITTMVFWGMSFIWYKQAYPEFRPMTVIQFRLLFSIPLIFAFSFLLKRLMSLKREDIKLFFLIALFEPFLYFVGESYGMKYVSSTLASILIATIPLISPFLAFYFFREKLSANNYLGMIVSFVGVLIVVYVDRKIGEAPWYGIALIMLAVFSALGYTVVLKRLSARYNALTIVSYQNLIGTFYFAPLFFIVDFKEFVNISYTWKDYLPILYLSFFASTVAFIFFVQGVKKLGISKAIVFTNFIPIVTAVLAVPMLNEKMSIAKAGGIFITTIGLFMSQAGGTSKLRIYSGVRKK
jgi:drug/metabolite transporter (DMT)-like permease